MKKKGPGGRPCLGKEPRQRTSVMIEPATRRYLRNLGYGNVSAGIALLVKQANSSKPS